MNNRCFLRNITLCVVLPFVVVLCFSGCLEQTNKTTSDSYLSNKNQKRKVTHNTIYSIKSFITEGTTYIYNDKDLPPYLIDGNYTPTQSHNIKKITVRIKSDKAIVYTGSYVTHRILSTKCYGLKVDGFEKHQIAILKTDKGRIVIAKTKVENTSPYTTDVSFLENKKIYTDVYSLEIKYGNFIACGGVYPIFIEHDYPQIFN